MLHTIIMAGGGGTRFWPRSRQQKPKQFLTLHGEQTLLQQAFERIEALSPPERTWIITGEQHQSETGRQLPRLSGDRIVGEPCGRDTAACIGLGAALIHMQDSDAVMLVLAADHVIEPAQEFRRAAQAAEHMALEHPQALITFGIRPTFAATGYGYIQRGPELAQRQGVRVFRVRAFREKPDAELAEQMLASGDYFWNAGIFCWKASTILEALRHNQPTVAAAVERIAAAWNTSGGAEIFRTEYERLTKISIDYAVMEKAKEVLMVEAPFQWDDVGSWSALERMHPQDADGNTVLAEHCGLATKDCIIAAEPGTLIATAGVDNLLIVQDGNAILVADRRDEAAVKRLVELLKQKGLERLPVNTAKTRILAVDPGKVRVGLAISDAERRLASPLATYHRQDDARDASHFKQVVAEEEIGLLVVGLPIHNDGREGDQAKAARAFGSKLEGWTGLPVLYWDERFTTRLAESALLEAGLTHQRRKERRDKVAAQMLLQSYLEAGCPT